MAPSVAVMICLFLCNTPAAVDTISRAGDLPESLDAAPQTSDDDLLSQELIASLGAVAGNDTTIPAHNQTKVLSSEGEEYMAREEEEEEAEEEIKHSKALEQHSKRKRGFSMNSLDDALNFIRSKFTMEQEQSASVNTRAQKAMKEVNELKSTLQSHTKDFQAKTSKLKKELQVVLAHKAIEDGQVKTLERHLLFNEQAVHNLNRSYTLRGKALELSQRRLSELSAKDAELKGRLDNVSISNGNLKQKLADALYSEHNLKTEQATAEAQLTITNATLNKLLIELDSLKNAKAEEDKELHLMSEKDEKVNRQKADEEARLSQAQADVSKLKDELRSATSQETKQERELQDFNKKLDLEMQRERHNEEAAAMRERVLHDSISGLKDQLGSDNNREQEMVNDWKMERAQLSEQANRSITNASEIQEKLEQEEAVSTNLKSEVIMLKKRVEDGDNARLRAERLVRESQAGATKAISEAKQLQGIIPFLRSKLSADENEVQKARNDEQLAHEARDAAKAMLADARREIDRLKQENAAALKALSRAVTQESPSSGNDILKDATVTMGQLDGLGSLTMGNLTDASNIVNDAAPSGSASGSSGSSTTAEVDDDNDVEKAAAQITANLTADITSDIPEVQD